MVKKNAAESSSGRKIYQYIPSDQRKEGDPIFRVIDKSSVKKGTKMPMLLPPLVQHKIEQDKEEPHECENKNKNVVHITLENKDDESLPISLYDNRVLYMMQKMDMILSLAHRCAMAGGSERHLKRRCPENNSKLYMRASL